MNLLTLSFAYLRAQAPNAALNVVLLAFGVATIALLLLFSAQLEDRLTRDAQGIDLVIGAKGSPLQLILSSVYHVDAPTGSVPLGEVERWAADPRVEAVIPIALGDTVDGFRIVGTTPAYVDHYRQELAEGRLWASPQEAVLGAEAARRLGLRLDDMFIARHGLGGGGAGHTGSPYRVVGLLAPGGTVLDRLALTGLESVWTTHGIEPPPAANDPDALKDATATAPQGGGDGPEVNAFLVRYAAPGAEAELPREVNLETRLQAAAPAAELDRLLLLVGTGIDALRVLGALLIAAAVLSVFVALWSGLKERRYDMAVMRTLGARRRTLMVQIVLEGLILASLGLLLGLAIGHGLAEVAPELVPALRPLGLTGRMMAPGEGALIALVLAVGVLAALLPALQAYRTDIAALLGSRG
ncbi:MAG TPA: FtsX-like permease family protein [Geminicoccaceae bacterium]